MLSASISKEGARSFSSYWAKREVLFRLRNCCFQIFGMLR